jgi:hypothetical protein
MNVEKFAPENRRRAKFTKAFGLLHSRLIYTNGMNSVNKIRRKFFCGNLKGMPTFRRKTMQENFNHEQG